VQVEYCTQIPSLNIAQTFYSGNGLVDILKQFSTKSHDWHYEREWRLIHAVKDTSFIYDANVLTGVYFGPDMPPSAREIVCLVLQGQNEHVLFYQGKRSEREFKVEFSPFTYTSHLEAKKRGLI
jgi:hypothetical protein